VTKYVLDTNLYVEAARSSGYGSLLADFAGAFLPQIYLHAVVVQELALGAVNAAARRQLEREVVAPFERRGRLVTPSFPAWKRAGEILAELVESRVISRGGVSRSFANDVLLAVSCREEGMTVITRNTADFERIAKVEAVRFVQPWPAK
jgi:predicted nucleic acid-binding protein